MGYDFIIDSRVGIVAYDVSIEDIEERKEKALVYPTIKFAHQRLGVHYNVVKLAAEKRKRIYSPFLQKELAIRYLKNII